MSARTDLVKARHQAIQRFLDDNVDLFGIQEADDVGTGPFILTDWCLVLHLRDMGVDDDTQEPNEVRAAFFRPGMGYSQRRGMVVALDEGIQFPRAIVEDDD